LSWIDRRFERFVARESVPPDPDLCNDLMST
jgi:hypothetical protein